MTNNHVLNREDIIKGNKINIWMNNGRKIIYIDDSKKVYTNESNDITIIEINASDGFDFNKFLEIDDSIYKENPYIYFKKRSIYLIHHPRSSDKPEFAVGLIKGISLDTNIIEHTCNSEPGSSGSPILDLTTNRIVGIHRASEISKKYNVGKFIKEPIEKFYEENKNKKELEEIRQKNQMIENEIKNIEDFKNHNNENKEISKNQYILNIKNNKLNDILENNKLELNSNKKEKIQLKNKENEENEFSVFNQNNKDDNIVNYKKTEGINYKEKKENNEININQLKSKKIINDNNNLIQNQIIEINNNNYNNNIDEIIIKYKKNKINVSDLLLKIELNGMRETSSNDKLFGEYFVKNNKNLCKIVIGNQEYELKSYLNEECNEVKKSEFEIKLKGISKIVDISYMFCGCHSLDSIEGFSEINTKNMTSFTHLFSFCKITSIPDISKWDTRNVEYMDQMFLHCFNLKTIPDISKWNTSKVKDISYLFGDCCSLQFLPDISKWNTSNLESMNGLFTGCKSLRYLPDISNWKTNKVYNMGKVFFECVSLLNLPDISKWDTSNVIDMNCMFKLCKSLEFLPDISKWNTSKVRKMRGLFSCCESLVFLPDISIWNTFNVEDMYCMFFGCKNLIELPDISKWNISNVKDKTNMFQECNKNIHIPDKFQINPIENAFGLLKNIFNI